MGARGEGGIILSQFFRGMAESVDGKDVLRAGDFVRAMRMAADRAYRGVMRPVEGTILTVARETSETLDRILEDTEDLTKILAAAVKQAQLTVSRTPELLPILEEFGVVDAGGLGLTLLLEGALRWAKGEPVPSESISSSPIPMLPFVNTASGLRVADRHLIELTYDTPLDQSTAEIVLSFLRRCHGVSPEITDSFQRRWMRGTVSYWSSMLATIHDRYFFFSLAPPDEELIAGERSLKARSRALRDMRELSDSEEGLGYEFPFSLAAVVSGEGFQHLFKSLGCHKIISGGDTMNPSVRDILEIVHTMPSHNVVILANSPKAISTAQEAANMDRTGRKIKVVESKSMPQGIAALLAADPGATLETNLMLMNAALDTVRVALVTRATRPVNTRGVQASLDDFIAISGKSILCADKTIDGALQKALKHLTRFARGTIDLYYGVGLDLETAKTALAEVRVQYPDRQVNLLRGGQDYYPWMVSVSQL